MTASLEGENTLCFGVDFCLKVRSNRSGKIISKVFIGDILFRCRTHILNEKGSGVSEKVSYLCLP